MPLVWPLLKVILQPKDFKLHKNIVTFVTRLSVSTYSLLCFDSFDNWPFSRINFVHQDSPHRQNSELMKSLETLFQQGCTWFIMQKIYKKWFFIFYLICCPANLFMTLQNCFGSMFYSTGFVLLCLVVLPTPGNNFEGQHWKFEWFNSWNLKDNVSTKLQKIL